MQYLTTPTNSLHFVLLDGDHILGGRWWGYVEGGRGLRLLVNRVKTRQGGKAVNVTVVAATLLCVGQFEGVSYDGVQLLGLERIS